MSWRTMNTQDAAVARDRKRVKEQKEAKPAKPVKRKIPEGERHE